MRKRKAILAAVMLILCCLQICPEQVMAATVKLNKTNLTMYVGNTTTLKVSGSSKKVIWSSSKKSVASVSSSGKVTAKKTGKTTIKAKVSGKTLKCQLTVKNPYLTAKKKNLKTGKSVQLRLVGTKIKSVKSSKPQVADVNDSGKVTAYSAGKATITLKGTNNKSYTCQIVTSGAKVSPEMNKSEMELGLTDTYKLRVLGYSGTIKWKSSKPEYVTVDKNGKVTAKGYDSQLGYGTSYIYAYQKNGTYLGNCAVTVMEPFAMYTTSVIDIGSGANLMVGETLKIKLRDFNQTPAWKSSNTKVAKVSTSGKITATGAGTAEIYVKIYGVYYSKKVAVESKWSYSKDRQTRCKTFYDGYTVTEYRFDTSDYGPLYDEEVWGWYEGSQESEVYDAINTTKIYNGYTGYTWSEELYKQIKPLALAHAAAKPALSGNWGGVCGIYLEHGGLPDAYTALRRMTWTVLDTNPNFALACFVRDFSKDPNQKYTEAYSAAFGSFYDGISQ